MLESVNGKNSYASTRMAQLPDVARGEKRKIRRGDCLWNIAKEEVKKQGKTTNAAISDYMLQIAKVNDFDTPEKRKNIKIGSEIFLPKQVKGVDKPKSSEKPQARSQVQNPAERSYAKIAQQILNDKNLYIEDAKLNLSTAKVYHVYTRKNINNTNLGRKVICSFNTKSDGKIDLISFQNSDGKLNLYGYDYDIDSHGKITTYDFPRKSKGKVDAAQTQAVFNKLQDMIK